MNKNAVIDLVLLNVLGGKLSDDANVYRADIEAYLDVAFGAAIKAVVVDAQALQGTPKPGVSQLGSALNTVYSPHKATPVKDTDRNLYRIDLPGVIAVPGNDGVSMVYPEKNPGMPFIRLDNAVGLAGAGHMTFLMPAFHVEEAKVYLHEYPLPVHPVIVMCCPSISILDGGQEIPYPDTVTDVAIVKAEAWFRRQRETMADSVSDDKDLNEPRKQ